MLILHISAPMADRYPCQDNAWRTPSRTDISFPLVGQWYKDPVDRSGQILITANQIFDLLFDQITGRTRVLVGIGSVRHTAGDLCGNGYRSVVWTLDN